MSTDTKPVIAVDGDDVLWQTMPNLIRFHNELYRTTHRIEDVIEYDVNTLWECDLAEMHRRIEGFYASRYNQPGPLPHAVESVAKLAERYNVHLVTARQGRYADITHQSLMPFGNAIKDTHFLGKAGGGMLESKAARCRRINALFHVEDAMHHATAVAEVTAVLLMDTSWNRAAPLQPNIIRVFGWKDVLREIADNHP